MTTSFLFNLFLIISTILTSFFWIIKFFFKKNNIINYISSYFPVLFLVFFFRSFLYEPFQIPSSSMMPALLPGDFILVEKFSYGIKNPINQKKFFQTNLPKRGEVAVFKYPKNKNLYYIKRVIGIPGDLIIYNSKNKKIDIYPNCNINNIYICLNKKNLTNYSNELISNFIQQYHFNKKNMIEFYDNNFDAKIKDENRLILRDEQIKQSNHNILLSKTLIDDNELYYKQKNLPTGYWIVPEKHYFMMGDNRDNSLDSRYWGFVSENNLVGKAIVIWMSIDYEKNIWKYDSIRLKRIGKIN